MFLQLISPLQSRRLNFQNVFSVQLIRSSLLWYKSLCIPIQYDIIFIDIIIMQHLKLGGHINE